MTSPFGGWNSEPTMPGPFSFLAQLGNIYAGHQEYVQQRRQQAIDTANRIINLRNMGLLQPEDFAHPEVQAIFREAGLPQLSAQPTSSELASSIKSRTLTEGTTAPLAPAAVSAATGSPAPAPVRVPLSPDKYSPDARSILGLPSAGAEAVDAGRVATTPAQVQSTQDTQFNNIADRIVADLFQKTHRIPTPQEAAAAGATDLRGSAFKNPDGSLQINEPYYAAAIQRFSDSRQALRNQTTKADNTGGGPEDQLKDLNQTVAGLNNEYARLESDAQNKTKSLSAIYKATGQLQPGDAETLQSIKDTQQQMADNRKQFGTYQQMIASVANKMFPGATGGATIQTRADWDNQYNAALTAIRGGRLSKSWMDYVTKLRAQKKTDQQIAEQMVTYKFGARP